MVRIANLAVCLVVLLNHVAAQAAGDGQRQYQARCSGCHGDDGSGGGHGPGIVDVRRPRATSKDAVIGLILKGIPDGGMPSFQIPVEEAGAIATYVMELKTPVANAAPAGGAPGDFAAGERFFAGKGNCAGCHMVRGRGGWVGPDLSNIGSELTPPQIEQALRDPGGAPPLRDRGGRGSAPVYRAVTVKLGDGRIIRGIAKNESGFDLQLLGTDGKLHLLLKYEVAEIVREKSLMPKVEATPNEIRDLVAYLSRLTLQSESAQ